MRKIYFLVLLSGIVNAQLFSQTSYLPLQSEEYQLLDRLEAFSGRLAPYTSSLKPTARKDAMAFLNTLKQEQHLGGFALSRIDNHNLQRALSISGEWTHTSEGMNGTAFSKKPILRYFYQRKPDMVHVDNDDFFLVVNPIIYTEGIKEMNIDQIGYVNTRGAELRGRIKNRVGFYTLLADNQEKPFSYVQAWETAHSAFPGFDYYRTVKNNNYDLFLARGYVDVNLLKDHLNITFGYDKNFLGDGLRSLFLSDYGAPATFLRLRSHYENFTYENLFLELTADYTRGGDQILPHKYATMHQLSYRAAAWLDIGIFESTVFAQENKFNAAYLLPVIFYRTATRALGADHKTSLGLNFKAIALRQLQFYGQAYFDQIKLNELNKGWWGNQFGFQLGGKYFDAFTLPNLDLQGEVNIVRPFTYASQDTVSNYTHYNQALAHPYGAGFAEVIGLARYQPIARLYLSAKGIYAMRGSDFSAADNYGNDIFKTYGQRARDYDFNLTAGEKISSIYFNFNAAFELRPRLFLEAGATHLRRTLESGISLPSSTSFYGGLRWNMARKEYDAY